MGRFWAMSWQGTDHCVTTTVGQFPDACAGVCVVQEAEHWEGQSALIYHIDLLSSLSLETLTLLHSLHVWCVPGRGRWHNNMGDCCGSAPAAPRLKTLL